MKDLAPFMGEDQEDIEHPEGGRRDGEEIDRPQRFGVAVEERLPGLGRLRASMLGPVLADG
jgi:hypothetical protein